MTKHASEVSALEILAIAANMVGKMIAMQDQRTVTLEMAQRVVLRNMEIGNQQMVDILMASKGSA